LKGNTRLVTAEFEVVTPMFLGGAQQHAEGIRPASVKGALRYWWRALNWGRLRDTASSDIEALNALHRRECHLFGQAAMHGPDGRVHGGQGCFLLSVRQNKLVSKPLGFERFSPRSYMLGLGLGMSPDSSTPKSNTTLRTAIHSGSFEVRLAFNPRSSPDDQASVLEAIRLFGTLGGLGARTRRGWGSVALTAIDGVSERCADQATFRAKVKGFLTPKGLSPAPFSSLSDRRLGKLAIVNGDALGVLDSLGKRMGLYRGYGRDGKVFGTSAIQNFVHDHDVIRAFAAGNANLETLPDRLVFGIPHNYFFSSLSRQPNKVDIQNILINRKPLYERRASPLFIHVHPIGEKFTALQFVLQSQFLPRDALVRVKAGSTPKDLPYEPDWEVLDDYIDGKYQTHDRD